MRSSIISASVVMASLVARDAFALECNALKKLDPGGTPGAVDAPPVVYVTGSSAVKPVLAALGPILFAAGTKPATIVYRSQGSCNGVRAALAGEPMALAAATTQAVYWDPNSTTVASGTATAKEEKCTFTNPGADVFADIGVSDVFAQTCGQALVGLPAGVADFQGPIQSMTFAVPKSSKENSISAEAAYMVFGHATLAPWTDQLLISRRNDQSGTQQMIATAIGVDATRWTGVNKGSSDNVFLAMSGALDQPTADKSIGILAADYSAKPELKQLAYSFFIWGDRVRPQGARFDGNTP